MRVSRTQLERAAVAVIATHKATATAPRVLWAGLDEQPAMFLRRVRQAITRPGLVLAAVPHGYRVDLPETVQRVEFPPKHFRVLHPSVIWRFKVLKGGRGAAKSWSIAKALVLLSLMQPLSILCCREIQNSIRASVHKLLSQQIRALGLERWFSIDIRAINVHNGSAFDFEGLYSNVDKIKSYEGADICWIEEGASISADSWEILEPTLRKPGSYFVCNYNPDGADDPTHKMFALNPRPDALVEHVTYADNPFLTEPLLKSMEYLKSVDADAHAHVWLGECRSHSDAQILKGKIRVEDFEPPTLPEKPTEEQKAAFIAWHGPYQGADWGFANDPTTLVRCWVSPDRRKLYIEHEVYAIGVDIDATPKLFDGVPNARKYRTRADSARPETISYMQRHGYPEVVSVTKRPGSVEDGVAFLRQFEQIVIHPRCVHAQEEARLYSYKVDRLTGDVLPEIVDKHNHIWDAVRYALEPLISQRSSGLLTFLQRELEAEKAKPERDKQTAPGVRIVSLTTEGHSL